MKFSNGDVYFGEFKEGNIHGKGIYSWKTGEIYNGLFIKGEIDLIDLKTNSI